MASKSNRLSPPLALLCLGLFLLAPAACRPDKKTDAEDSAAWKSSIVERDGDFFIARVRPPDSEKLPVKDILTRAERRENFLKLWDAADRYYCFFPLKKIDWPAVKETYQHKLDALENGGLDDERATAEFYNLLRQLVTELRDGHSWILNRESPSPAWPAVLVGRVEGQAVVLRVRKNSDAEQQGLAPGAVIVEVDGKNVAERLAEIQKEQLPLFREGALLHDAYRELLDGEGQTKVRLGFLPPGAGAPREAELMRESRSRMLSFPPSFEVTKGKYLRVGKHPSGYGYIRIPSFGGRDGLDREFLRALRALADTPGLIIDVRDNPGGLGYSKMIRPFLSGETLTGMVFNKNGPGHADFKVDAVYLHPLKKLPYLKPVALLINSQTGSASDLFVLRMLATGRTFTVGQTTRGNLAGGQVYVHLPCGLLVRISNSYAADPQGQPVEWRGAAPDLPVEPTMDDLIHGRDAVLETAVEELKSRSY